MGAYCDEDLLPVNSTAGAPTNELRLRKHVYECNGNIYLDPICMKLIHTEKLRRFRELHAVSGGTRVVYPGAVHSRFDADSDRYDLQTTVRRAGILHGPFSHKWSQELIWVNMIDHIHIHVDAQMLKRVKDMILARPEISELNGNAEKRLLYDIVANGRNGIDVDNKFDCLVRGCNLQFQRLTETMRVMDNEICYRAKEYNPHRTVYTHPKVKATELTTVDATVKANHPLGFSSCINDQSEYCKRVQKRSSSAGGSLKEPEVSDAEDGVSDEDDDPMLMRIPGRSHVLEKHPELLHYAGPIQPEIAESCLTAERYVHVVEQNPNNEKLFFSDSNGRMVIHWKPSTLDHSLITQKTTRRMFKDVSGYIWNQFMHPLCWAFSSADLISASLVLYGWEEKYIPLCPLDLCQHVDPQMYGNNLDNTDHSCYAGSVEAALLYVMGDGIQKSRLKRGMPFDCGDITVTEDKMCEGIISDVYKYNTLPEALLRLKTHSVAAYLFLCEGWEDDAVYRGPKDGSKWCGGVDHAVLMQDCRLIDNEMVVKCKSSNGEATGRKGYILVSAEVMMIVVASTRKKDSNSDKWFSRKPRHLLSDFYSIGMKPGRLPLKFVEDPQQAKENLKYKIDYKEMVVDAQNLKFKIPESEFEIMVSEDEEDGEQDMDVEQDMGVKIKGDFKLGIHLGTTYCCICSAKLDECDEISSETIANDRGKYMTPCWVGFTESETLIGETAMNQAGVNPERTIFDVKRLMGRKFKDEEVQNHMKRVPYEIVDKGGYPYIQVKMKDGETKDFSPEQISAMILTKMKETAEAYIGVDIKDAVISIPAYFNKAQREATENAGALAGLNVFDTIREPFSAHLVYDLPGEDVKKKKKKKNILVFHLGGGTCSVCILQGDDGDVFSKIRDMQLGGNDFDQRIVEHFVNIIKKKYKKDITNDRRAISKLRLKCERAKRSLSQQVEVRIKSLSLLGDVDFSETLTRDCFEKLNNDLFKKTLVQVRLALKDAGLKKMQIDDIILIGGSTRIPKVQEMLKKCFGGADLIRCEETEPDEVVAYGAAALGLL